MCVYFAQICTKKVYFSHIFVRILALERTKGKDFELKLPCPDMEIIDDDAERANIQFVKINDKRLGKSFGIKKFPALTMIRFLSKTDKKSSQN